MSLFVSVDEKLTSLVTGTALNVQRLCLVRLSEVPPITVYVVHDFLPDPYASNMSYICY